MQVEGVVEDLVDGVAGFGVEADEPFPRAEVVAMARTCSTWNAVRPCRPAAARVPTPHGRAATRRSPSPASAPTEQASFETIAGTEFMVIKRRLIIASLLICSWVVIALAGVVPAVLLTSMGDGFCEAGNGDSNYGFMEWSWAPPGPHCVWTVESNGFASSSRPSPIWSVWLATVVVVGCLAGWQEAAALSTRDTATATPPAGPPSPPVRPRSPRDADSTGTGPAAD